MYVTWHNVLSGVEGVGAGERGNKANLIAQFELGTWLSVI